MDVNNDDNLYFNTTQFGEPETISNSDRAQETVYKCYDLQILYLIKHLEVVELFKLFFYYSLFETKNKAKII